MSRILIVDDDADLVEACQLVLEDAGHTVEGCTEARLIGALARRCQPDVLLLDWVLDGLNADDVLRDLREDPRLRALPVVVMSALESGELRARGARADSYLAKPFHADALIERIERATAGHAVPADASP